MKLTSTLNDRQREALRLAALGQGDREIGRKLGLRPVYVRQLLSGAYHELGVTSRIDAFRALGWLRPPERL